MTNVRTIVVTGSASGIGQATAQLLRDRGDRVIGVDISPAAEIRADLCTDQGRRDVVDQVTAFTDGIIDAVVACAGVPGIGPATVSLNYFGTVAVLEGLRPLLARSAAPRAAVVSSTAAMRTVDDCLMGALAQQDEARAVERVAEMIEQGVPLPVVYACSKRALSQWVRRVAPTDDWAGAAIALNAIAPGVVITAMTTSIMQQPGGAERMAERNPMPLNGFATAAVPASLLVWLAGVENTHLCGQVLYLDGGGEAMARTLQW